MSYKKMDPKHKTRWLKALRSGKYGQAQEQLYGGDNTYCCLGVLCEVTPQIVSRENLGQRQYNLKLELSERQSQEGSDLYLDDPWEDLYVDGDLNPEMMTFFGISAAAQKRLIHMNDNEGKTFEQIANWVEKNL